jgi:hypothetical protein
MLLDLKLEYTDFKLILLIGLLVEIKCEIFFLLGNCYFLIIIKNQLEVLLL